MVIHSADNSTRICIKMTFGVDNEECIEPLMMCMVNHWNNIIRVYLNELHTRRIAHVCVYACMLVCLWLLTVNHIFVK